MGAKQVDSDAGDVIVDVSDAGLEGREIDEPSYAEFVTERISEANDDEAGDVDDDDDLDDNAGADDDEGGEPSATTEDEEDVAPQLKDLASAKKAYNDVRAYANTLRNEQAALLERLEELEMQNLDSGFDYDGYDSQQFTKIAAQNPMEAFQYALESGAHEDALTAIAQVNADANRYAAQAALAAQNDEAEQAQHFDALARNAAAYAESMRNEHQEAVREESMAPMSERAFLNDLTAASQFVQQKHGADVVKYTNQIRDIVQEFPNMLGDGSQAALARGIERAYKMAKSEAGGNDANIEELIAAKVAEAIGAQRKGKASRSASAQGEGSGRRAPSSGVESDPDRDGLGLGSKSGPIGLNAFWNM